MEEQFIFKHVRKNNSYLQSDEYANDTEIVITLNGEQNLTQVFEAFKGYLQAVGFCLRMGDRIDIVNDEVLDSADDVWDDEDKDEESWEDPGYEEKDSVSKWDEESESEEMPVFDVPQSEYGSEPYELSTVDYDEYAKVHNGATVTALHEMPQIDTKLTKLHDAIIPFLENLKKDPEKTMLRWPNRTEVINSQINKIRKIIGE